MGKAVIHLNGGPKFILAVLPARMKMIFMVFCGDGGKMYNKISVMVEVLFTTAFC